MKSIKFLSIELFKGLLILSFLAVLGSLNIYTVSFIITDLFNSSLRLLIALSGVYILVTVISLKSIQAIKQSLKKY
jgi:hypothetical protein